MQQQPITSDLIAEDAIHHALGRMEDEAKLHAGGLALYVVSAFFVAGGCGALNWLMA